MQHYRSGVLLAIGAAVLFSAKAVIVKLAYRFDIDATTLLTLRMLFALPVCLGLAAFSMRKHRASGLPPLRAMQWLQISALGICSYYIAAFLDLAGLQYITANLERLIVYLYPTITLILSALLFKRRFAPVEIVCLAAAYGGVALVFSQNMASAGDTGATHMGVLALSDTAYGTLLVVGSALAFSIYLVGSEKVMASISSRLFTAYSMMASAVAIGIHFLATRPAGMLIQPLEVYGLAFCIGVVVTVLPSLLMAEGVKRIGAARASIIGSMGPVATVILGYFLLGETITLLHVAGMAIVIASITALSLARAG